MQPSSDQRLAAVMEAGQRAEQRLARYQQMQEELKSLEVKASSPDRAVTVVAGPNGAIKDVQLTDDALRMSAQTLSRAVLGTIQRAAADAARRMAEIVRDHAGERADVVARVAVAQEEALTAPTASQGFVPGRP